MCLKNDENYMLKSCRPEMEGVVIKRAGGQEVSRGDLRLDSAPGHAVGQGAMLTV